MFTYIGRVCFIVASLWLPQCQWIDPGGYENIARPILNQNKMQQSKSRVQKDIFMLPMDIGSFL